MTGKRKKQLTVGSLRECITQKGRKKNASLTTRALNKADSDKIRNNEHTDEGYPDDAGKLTKHKKSNAMNDANADYSRSKGRIFLAHRNREHRTQNRQHMMSKYNLDVMDEVTRDTIP